MPTKNEILLRFQKDLEALNARFEAELSKIERARLKKFGTLPASRPAVEELERASAAAAAERTADRARATGAREKAVAAAADKRRAAFRGAEEARLKAETKAERERDDARAKENRRHADALEEISKVLPLYKQTPLREAEDDRHEQALSRIQEDFEAAWDRARESLQSGHRAALDDELLATEAANDAEREGLIAADLECAQTLHNAGDKLHDALLKQADTKDLEEGFQQQLRDARQDWEAEKAALRAKFKKAYGEA